MALAILFILLGPIMVFYGRKFIPLVVGIMGGFVTFLIIMIFESAFGMLNYVDPTKDGGSLFVTILAFLIAIALGIIAGIVLNRYLMVGLCIMAGVGGYLAGMVIYNTIISIFTQSAIALACMTFGLGAVTAGLAFLFKDHIVIFTTALIGSYITIRGISMFAGGFPNEFTLYQQILNGTA